MQTDPVLVYITQNPGCTAADIRSGLGMDESGVYRAARDLCDRGSVVTSLVRRPHNSRHVKSFHPAPTPPMSQPILIPPHVQPPAPSASRFRVRTTVDLTIGGHVIPLELSEIRELVADLQNVLSQIDA
jgi:hypothetical protein